MHNLGTVFTFEVIRTLKKKTFWFMALSFPILIAAVFAIIFFSSRTTEQAAEDTKNQTFSIAVTDNAKTVNPAILAAAKAEYVNDKQTAIERVKDGKLDAYFYYPDDLSKSKVEIYARDVGLFDNGRYEGVAKLFLEQSVAGKVDPAITAILQDKIAFSATTYKNGEQFNGFQEMIAPGLFLVLFYFLIAMFGNQCSLAPPKKKRTG